MFVRRAALLILRDKQRKILLQHRDKDISRLPDYWGFFGGEINEGESPEQALKREAKEELELEIDRPKLFKRYEIQEEDGLHEKFAFTIPLEIPIRELKNRQKEGQDLGLFSFEEIKNLKLADCDMIIIKDLFNK